MEGNAGYYVWRRVSRDGVAYLCVRRKRRTAPENEADELRVLQATSLPSRDGFSWSRWASCGRSTAARRRSCSSRGGYLLAMVRNRAAELPARVCRAGAPYRAWSRRDLERNIGGPLLARWGSNLRVGGRKHIAPDRAVTALYWLVDARLQEAVELPAPGQLVPGS